MKPKVYVAKDISELLDLTTSMLLSAPKFLDKTGYLPFMNLDYAFRELREGLDNNRLTLGEGPYQELMRLSAQIQALFESDPEDKTGATSEGCKIIHKMEEILNQAWRKI